MLKIYNTITRQKEEFQPIHPGKVNLYVCGMTVYDYCHVGHARGLVVFDVIVRYLRDIGYDVNFTRNITDIDDKIIERAKENKEDYKELTARFIQAMHEDANALGILPTTHEPRATEHIPEIIQMIEKLIEKKHAYIASNGDIYYSVKSFPNYGELAHQDLETLLSGVRVDVTEAKKDPLDFVLWKMAKPDEPSWDSPWGAGRPGWHIECSAMSTKCLGNHFDIHGGGFDLIFPHHQNEIAQTEAASGEKFVNFWMHVGFVTVKKEKMSKSLGNFFTIREVMKEYRPEVIRYFMLASQYRSPVNYSTDNLDSAKAALERFYTSMRGLPEVEVQEELLEVWRDRFIEVMNDDFNTPEALAVLFDCVREINRLRESDLEQAAALAAILRYLGKLLGILEEDPQQFLHTTTEAIDVDKIEQLIQQRKAARDNKDWVKADEVRDALTEMGVSVEDTSEGTIWRVDS